jgi:hypothetical protein
MVQTLLQFATGLGLNTENLAYQQTLQQGCWWKQIWMFAIVSKCINIDL